MHQKNLVICDAENEYAKNLKEEFLKRKGLSFQPYLFSDPDHLEDFSESSRIHILIMGEEFPEEKRMGIPAEERFVLVKRRGRNLNREEKELFRYQSADRILAHILKRPGDEGQQYKGQPDWDGDLIGVYSPVHRIGKTKFAISLGQKLAEKSPALYLNMEEYSGMEQYLPGCGENDLSDLLYYMKQEDVNLGLKLSEMTSNVGKLDYVAPIPLMQDLISVEPEEWLDLFREIFSRCAYKAIILDLGDCVKGLYSILRRCSTVYTLHTQDPTAQAKIKQYTENLRLLGYTDVIEHTVMRQVPEKAGEI